MSLAVSKACRILTVGPNRCLIECGGRDLTLRYRDISYSSYDDLRKKYRPGEHYDCILKEYNWASGLMRVSIKEAAPNPFEGAIVRHPLGCRRQAYNPMERRKFNRAWHYGRCGDVGKFNSDYISDNHYFSRYRFAFRYSN